MDLGKQFEQWLNAAANRGIHILPGEVQLPSGSRVPARYHNVGPSNTLSYIPKAGGGDSVIETYDTSKGSSAVFTSGYAGSNRVHLDLNDPDADRNIRESMAVDRGSNAMLRPDTDPDPNEALHLRKNVEQVFDPANFPENNLEDPVVEHKYNRAKQSIENHIATSALFRADPAKDYLTSGAYAHDPKSGKYFNLWTRNVEGPEIFN